MQDKLESTATAATTAAPSGRGRRLNLRDRVVRPLVIGLAYVEATPQPSLDEPRVRHAVQLDHNMLATVELACNAHVQRHEAVDERDVACVLTAVA